MVGYRGLLVIAGVLYLAAYLVMPRERAVRAAEPIV